MRGLDSIVGKLAEVLAQLQCLLCSQRLDVRHAHVCDNAHFLFLGFCFRLFELLIKDRPVQPELSAEHDVLLDEKSLLPPVKPPASDLFALVPDSWVWIESGLLLPAFGCLDVGGGLRER